MNKILIIILLGLISFTSFGQDYQPLKKTTISQNIRLPLDTVILPLWVGEVRYRVQDSALYVSISTTAPQKWKKDVPSGSGITSLNKALSPTDVTILPDVGSSLSLPSATESDAGVFPALDKKKLNRFEPAKNLVELKAVTALDTSIIYLIKDKLNLREYYYDPADVSSVEDTSLVIVTTGGGRLKRLFRGLYRPEDFGAIGNGVANDQPAFQKMINYIETINAGGSVWMDSKANYKIDTNSVISIGAFASSSPAGKILKIYGNGAKMTGMRIFERKPPNQSVALSQWIGGGRIMIENITFIRTGGVPTFNAVAVNIGASYSSVVEGCTFYNFDTCMIYRFGLNTTSRNNMLYPRKVGLYFTYGGSWGGSTANSQSNGSISDQDRVFGLATTGFAGMYFESASDCEVRRTIIEGTAMDYGIYFDNRASTVVQDFKVSGAHIEFGTGPKRAAFYLRAAGVLTLEQVYIQVVDTFLIVDAPATLHLLVQDVPFLPSGTKFATTVASTSMKFERIYPQDGDPIVSHFVVGGDYVKPTAIVEHSTSAINTQQAYTIADSATSSLGKYLQVDIGQARVQFNRLNAIFSPDNTFDIGANSLRPRIVNAGTGFGAEALTGTYRWGSVFTGNGLAQPETGTIRMITGSGVIGLMTGAFGITYGTTAQRPVSPRNGDIRINIDSIAVASGLEIRVNSAWRSIASKQNLTDSAAVLRSLTNGIVDKFSLTTTGSRAVSAGETVYEIHLKPTANMTIDVGTAAAGSDIQDDLVLTANTTEIITYKKTADSGFTLHFTGVAGGTLNIIVVKRIL